MMDGFRRGFNDELGHIKEALWGAVAYAVPTVGFAAYDTQKALREQLKQYPEGERPEEVKEKTYFSKYPGLMGTNAPHIWGTGKLLEGYGRKGETLLHRAASAGAGTLGAATQVDPLAMIQKGVGL